MLPDGIILVYAKHHQKRIKDRIHPHGRRRHDRIFHRTPFGEQLHDPRGSGLHVLFLKQRRLIGTLRRKIAVTGEHHMKNINKRFVAYALGIVTAFAIAQVTSTSEPLEETPEPTPIPEILATSTSPIVPPQVIEEPIFQPIKIKGQPELTKEAYDLVLENRSLGIKSNPETWILALEWCESRGNNTAVNAEDLDGTPSYYAFQFKPGTFRGYAEKYGIIEKGLSDRELMNELADYSKTRATVWEMMQDSSVKWETQFPWCVKKHIGWPPSIVPVEETYASDK